MSGGYSGRFSLKFLFALVCAFFAFSIAVNCFESYDVRADGVVDCGVNSAEMDSAVIYVNSWGFESNVESISLKIVISCSPDDVDYLWGSNNYSSNLTCSEDVISVTVVPDQWVAFLVSCTNKGSDFKVEYYSYSVTYSA